MKSFEIIADGVSLDVESGSKLSAEFVCTTFNDSSVFAGSFSYPISFPTTPKNIAFFEHSHHLENRAGRKKREVLVVLFGLPWKKADLEYSIRGNVYSGHLKIDNGKVADWMRDTKLVDVFSSENNNKRAYKTIALGEDSTEVVDSMLSHNRSELGKGYCWPLLVNPFFTGEELDASSDLYYINHFNNMAEVADTRLYTPMLYWTWVIKEVCAWLGFKASGDYLEDSFVQSLVIYNNGARTGLDWKNNGDIKIAQHLPDVSISELFKAIRNDHRVLIHFDSQSNVVSFQKSNAVLGGTDRQDLKSMIHRGSLEIDPLQDTAYKLVVKIDDADELYNATPYEKSVMIGYDLSRWKELPMSIGKVFMQSASHFGIANVITPYAWQIGNVYSESFAENEQIYNGGNVLSKNPFSLRLLSYKGLQNIRTSPAYTIPFATSEKEGNLGQSYAQSLDHGGSGGLVYNYSLPWYRYFCLSEKVTLKCDMTVTQFFNLDPLRKIEICGPNQGNVEALLDKIVFEPKTAGETIVAKIQCYPNYNIIGSELKMLVGNAVIENIDGTIYAKLFMRHNRAGYEGNHRVDYQNMWVEFYSDPGGLIPREVRDVEFSIWRQKHKALEMVPVGDKESLDYIGNGIRADLGEFKYWENLRGPEYMTYYYAFYFAQSPTVTSLGEFKWRYNDWEPEV